MGTCLQCVHISAHTPPACGLKYTSMYPSHIRSPASPHHVYAYNFTYRPKKTIPTQATSIIHTQNDTENNHNDKKLSMVQDTLRPN